MTPCVIVEMFKLPSWMRGLFDTINVITFEIMHLYFVINLFFLVSIINIYVNRRWKVFYSLAAILFCRLAVILAESIQSCGTVPVLISSFCSLSAKFVMATTICKLLTRLTLSCPVRKVLTNDLPKSGFLTAACKRIYSFT